MNLAFFAPFVLLEDSLFFLGRKVVLDVEPLANLLGTLALDQFSHSLAREVEERLNVEVVGGQNELKQCLLVHFAKLMVPFVTYTTVAGGCVLLAVLNHLLQNVGRHIRERNQRVCIANVFQRVLYRHAHFRYFLIHLKLLIIHAHQLDFTHGGGALRFCGFFDQHTGNGKQKTNYPAHSLIAELGMYDFAIGDLNYDEGVTFQNVQCKLTDLGHLTMQFTYVNKFYVFSIKKWSGDDRANFLGHFFELHRDPVRFGNGSGDLWLDLAQCKNCYMQAATDVLSVLAKIIATHQRAVLSYAVWYQEYVSTQQGAIGADLRTTTYGR